MALSTTTEFRTAAASSRKGPELLLHPRIGQPVLTQLTEAAGSDLLVRAPKNIAHGTMLDLICQTGFPPEERRWKGVVQWSSRHKDCTELGIALAAKCPPELLVETGGSFRRQMRFQCKLNGMLSRSGGARVPVTIMNYSRMGFCLQSGSPLTVGEELELHWSPQPAGTPGSAEMIRVTGVVRWLTPIGNVALAGCKLTSGREYPFSDVDVIRLLR